MGHVNFYAHIWAFVTSISHMGEILDADWSRQHLLRSDWLGLLGATITTHLLSPISVFTGFSNIVSTGE